MSRWTHIMPKWRDKIPAMSVCAPYGSLYTWMCSGEIITIPAIIIQVVSMLHLPLIFIHQFKLAAVFMFCPVT